MGCSRPAGCCRAEAGLACCRPPPCMSSSSLYPSIPAAPLPGRTQRASRTPGVRARNAPHNKHTVTPGPAHGCPRLPASGHPVSSRSWRPPCPRVPLQPGSHSTPFLMQAPPSPGGGGPLVLGSSRPCTWLAWSFFLQTPWPMAGDGGGGGAGGVSPGRGVPAGACCTPSCTSTQQPPSWFSRGAFPCPPGI